MTGRAARMSPVTVFIGVIAWDGSGDRGTALGVPVLRLKTVCDRVEHLSRSASSWEPERCRS